MESLSMSSALFSKVRQRVLALIFSHPERSFYTSEIIRSVHSGSGAVERELSRLRRSGLVIVEQIGNQKHYRANVQSPIFQELRSLVIKTVGVIEPISKALEPYSDRIKTAFIYGSVANETDTAQSDIDVIVIGDDLSYSELYTAFNGVGSLLQRKVNPIFFGVKDWRRKAFDKRSFVGKISAQPRLFIFGSDQDARHGQARARQPCSDPEDKAGTSKPRRVRRNATLGPDAPC